MKDIDFKTKLIDLCDWFMGTSAMIATKGGYKGTKHQVIDQSPPAGGDYIIVTKWHCQTPNPICGECFAPSHHKWNGENWIHSCSKCKQRADLSLQAFKELTN